MFICVYVAICHPHAHHACAHVHSACMQINAVKIASVDRVLTLNVAHQTTKPWS